MVPGLCRLSELTKEKDFGGQSEDAKMRKGSLGADTFLSELTDYDLQVDFSFGAIFTKGIR